MEKRGVLRLVAGHSSQTGAPAYEEVHVEDVGPGRFRVLQSPGFVLGVAGGDEIELDPKLPSGFRVLSRGGNVSIQFFREGDLQEAEDFLTENLARLGGWRDGREKSVLVFSVPVSAGFPAIEKVMRGAMERFPDAEWGFGNVYDPEDGVTPLKWWE